jgi:hypothetical protein
MFCLNPVGFCTQFILRIWTGGAHYSGRRKTRTPYKTGKSGGAGPVMPVLRCTDLQEYGCFEPLGVVLCCRVTLLATPLVHQDVNLKLWFYMNT